jgi:hypothetical protein
MEQTAALAVASKVTAWARPIHAVSGTLAPQARAQASVAREKGSRLVRPMPTDWSTATREEYPGRKTTTSYVPLGRLKIE